MQTAIIKTDIWKDRNIRQLNLDTKIVYLCLLTNPERNTTRFLKIDEDYLCLQSGIDYRQLEQIKTQLETNDLVYFVDSWAIFCDTAYVEPAKGKLSQIIYNRDLEKVPKYIQDYMPDKLFQCGSGATPVYKDKDKVKDKDIIKDIVKDVEKIISSDAIKSANLLKDKIISNYPFMSNRIKDKDIDRWANDIEKINRIDKYDYATINGVIVWVSNDDFWKQNIKSGSKLREKFNDLLIRIDAQYKSKGKAMRVIS